MVDSAEEREEALAGAPEIPPSEVLRDVGTAPRNVPEVRAAIWKELRPQRLSPDAAMMVLMAKLPSKLLPLASVYRPTAKVHLQPCPHRRPLGALGACQPGPDPVLPRGCLGLRWGGGGTRRELLGGIAL